MWSRVGVISEDMNYHAESIRRAVGQIAERKDELEKTPFLRNEIPREFIKRYLELSDVVLDAGGTGINAIMMARVCKRVTLIGISPKVLKLAEANVNRAGLAAKIDLGEADITDLGRFEDGQFSFVICVGGALSHVLDKNRQAMGKLVRVARKVDLICCMREEK